MSPLYVHRFNLVDWLSDTTPLRTRLQLQLLDVSEFILFREKAPNLLIEVDAQGVMVFDGKSFRLL